MGWFATCTDTQGNEFGLWQSDPSAPAPTGQASGAGGGVPTRAPPAAYVTARPAVSVCR